MTELEIRKQFVKTAEKYLGYNEQDGSYKKIIDLYNTQKPLPAGYKVKYTDAWCATYVSAMAVDAGLTDIIYPECSCGRMVKLYQNNSAWIENDNHIPQIGDIIFYDLKDNGVGDNEEWPNHVGIITDVDDTTLYIIDGNWGDQVARRKLSIGAKTIRGFGAPLYSSKATTQPIQQSQQLLSGKIETNLDLAQAAIDTANNFITLYVNGCFGAPMNNANKQRYCNNTSYNRQPERTQKIMAASPNTFGFDCVCFVKGLLWGWRGDTTKEYGGAVYQSNGVPDIGVESMLQVCSDISSDFNNIEVGEYLWIEGHAGIYVGDGLAVECVARWKDGVQITACNCDKPGYNRRNWTKHGKLPYIKYIPKEQKKEEQEEEKYTQEQFIKEVQSIVGLPQTGKSDETLLNKTITLSSTINNRHALVRPVQKYLYALGYKEVGEADGAAGPKFTQAVKAYQKAGGGTVDGEITAKKTTWKRLLGYSQDNSYTVQVTAQLLNVRRGPGTNYSVVTQIKNGTKHSIIEEKNGWGHISNSGWVSLKHVKKV